MGQPQDIEKRIRTIYHLTVMVFGLVLLAGGALLYLRVDPTLSVFRPVPQAVVVSAPVDPNQIENGIHLRTGLIEAEGLMTVVNNCTNCHSAKLIVQNRMNAERWHATIRWMQETQNLWPLGDNEEIIINYLVTNYPPKSKGRRENLSNIEWYELEN